jgi:hypothetical protein
MKRTSIGLALAFGMIGSASAAVNCNSFPNSTISGSVNDDVVAVGYNCTIAATGFVNGNLIQSGPGSLLIRGVVNGGVEESGSGSISIVGGRVGGGVTEADGGNVVLRRGASVNGGVEESGPGDVRVTVDLPGVVNADIIESGTGSVFIDANTGSYEGSVFEFDDGSVAITVDARMSFKGNVEEYGVGDITADIAGVFEGNVAEYGTGDVATDGSGTFKGNSEYQLPGDCTNMIGDFQGAACNLL